MGSCGNAVVAAGRTAIARGDKDRNTLGHGLLIGRVIGGVSRCAVLRLALAVADAHDGRCLTVAVDQIFDGNQSAERGGGIRARCQLQGGARRRGAGPFRVQYRFRVVRGDHAGIAAVVGAA